MPRIQEDPMSIIRSQKLRAKGGQRYLVRRWVVR